MLEEDVAAELLAGKVAEHDDKAAELLAGVSLLDVGPTELLGCCVVLEEEGRSPLEAGVTAEEETSGTSVEELAGSAVVAEEESPSP